MGEDAITELERLLKDERDAIRRLDGTRVLVYAERKESLVRALGASGGDSTLSKENGERLRALAPALRHNSVLLAHARDVLRDALVVARTGLGGGAPARAMPAGMIPRILSVRG
jgi:hypothetical protein